MAALHQLFIILSLALLAFSFSPVVSGASVPGKDDNSTSDSAAQDLKAAASEVNNVNVQGTSATVFSSSQGPQPQGPPRPQGPVTPGYAAPPPASVPYLGPPGPAGFGFPGLGGNIGLDISAGGYYPIVEKVIVVIGGGILLLVILAIIQAFTAKGGFGGLGLGGLFSGGFGTGISGSASASASASASKNVQLTDTVTNSINKKF